MKKRIWLLAALFAAIGNASAQKSPVVPSSLEKATVFLQGAELEHKAKVNVPAGVSEIVIGDLADVIDENSIQAGSEADLTIMSASVARDFLTADKLPVNPVAENIKKLIEAATQEKTRLQNQKAAENAVLELLAANKSIGGSNTGVNLAELMKTADYVKAKTLEVKNSLMLLDEKLAKQTELLAKLQSQLAESQSLATRDKGRIVLQVMSKAAVSTNLTLSYITRNAWWKPLYDIKVGDLSEKVKLLYKAEIHQSSGLDWNKIKVSLASSMPSQFGTAPLLNAWYLQYYVPGSEQYQRARSGVDNRAFNSYNAPALKKEIVDLTGAAQGVRVEEKKDISDYVTVNENPIYVTFDIDLPYNIPSDGKAYGVAMKEYELAATFKHYSVPKLDRDVYLLAQITDWEKLNLLPGDASIVLNHTYVGKTMLSLGSSDTMSITVGRDKRVVVKREKLVDYSSVKFIGTNKTQKFTYEITVKNSNNDKIKYHLKDQIPLSTDKNIEIELLESDGAELNPDLGVLNWIMELQPKETRKIRFTYTVKYPRDKQIRNL